MLNIIPLHRNAPRLNCALKRFMRATNGAILPGS